jgi:sarcosine oxidase subunit beta
MQSSADVVVVGGGVIGTAVTYYLARQGVDVCLVEQNDIASGTSSACAIGVALQTKPPGPKQELARASLDLYRGLTEELESDIEFANEGGMLVAENEEQLALIAKKAEKASKAGLAIELLSAEEAHQHQPNLAPHIVGATYCADDATVNPYKLAFAFVDAARRVGAAVYTETEVTAIERQGEDITAVVTSRGRINTKTVVNAAGPWAPLLAEMAGVDLPVKPRKGELLVTEPGPPLIHGVVVSAGYLLSKAMPKGSNGGMTAGLWTGQTGRGNLLVGSTREFAGYDRSSSYEGMQALLHHITRFYAGLRPASSDGLPILGRSSQVPGFVLANGHEGDGIALSPVTGKRIADLLTGKITEDLLAPFAPGRWHEGANNEEPA